jgi:hypothetical protein
MKKVHSFVVLLSLILITPFFFSCDSKPTRDLYPKELIGGFDLLPSEATGIDFNNTIQEGKTFNHYFFGQIYSGSGVAIGDLNNDGLPDIYFGGNQVGDRLYLNKGNFQFEDISKSSKIAYKPGWTWGVTMVDINADGYLDIYVSRNGTSANPKDRRNLLFINNKDLTFTESAIQYGLADVGFSTQAVFFDMDNDGDLDMYQLNQLADKKLLLINKIPKDQFKYFKDHLYRNDNGKFTDVSAKAGISRNVAYGLSVNASDFNNDGFIDLYVANDYIEPDFLYYNNGDGTFTNVINENLKHITQLSMGSDTGDINNDGFLDLMTTDMAPEDHYRSKTNMASMSTERFRNLVKSGAHYQYSTNTLQINTGLGHFSDIATMSGVAFTDWSWASLMVDLDNDGWKDIVVTNGVKKDLDNNDYRLKLDALPSNTTIDELFELSKKAPSQKLSNYAFKNVGQFKFKKVAKDWGLDTPSFSNGMAYADLDNDGDLDLVINNIEDKAFIYRNKATGNFLKIEPKGEDKNPFGIGAKAFIYYNGQQQMAENITSRGYFSSVEPNLFFGLGKETNLDSVKVVWQDGKVNLFKDVEVNRTITASYSKAKAAAKVRPIKPFLAEKTATDTGLDFKHQENNFDDFTEEILLPHQLSQNGPFIASADVNNDGLDDLFVGGAANQRGVLYLQNEQGNYVKSPTQPWEKDKASEDLGAVFFDSNGDKKLDLYVTSGGNEFKQGNKLLQDRLYIGNGDGSFRRANRKALPTILESTQTVQVSDLDNDGDLDLFVGTRLISGKYTYPASSYFLINNKGFFKKAQSYRAPALKDLGMVTDAVFSDIDNDNDEDLIIVGEWMTVTVLENTKGMFKDVSNTYGLDDTTRGMWWSITASDLDNDGDDDYILGNLGKNNKFKASKEHPFKVYANDFDNNGTNDVVLAKFYKNDYVPVRGRECTSQQMPYVAKKFKDYHSFASSKLIDILPEDKVDDAVVYQIENFESIILENKDGKLVRKPLSIQAQVSPIKSSLVLDINNDGFKDIITVGNHYGVEVETTRYDAGYGAVFLGSKNMEYTFVSPQQSGFYVPKDSRDIVVQKVKNKEIRLLVANNNELISIFEKSP